MITLVLAFHNHQPVGNFGWVIEEAYQRAYLPLMEIIGVYPKVRFAQHYTGILLDWFAEHHPEFLSMLHAAVEHGRMEPVSGGYYEPILSALPERDRNGQIVQLNARITGEFGVVPEGMWVAERVWEPQFAGTLHDAGIRYTFLDDTHFKCAGLDDKDLTGYFLTEDEGKPLAVFPIDKRLRYTIPFAPPEETFRYLKSLNTDGEDRVVVFADDGEKFGVWPKTFETVYGQGWLVKFLDLLSAESDWVRTALPSEVLRTHHPVGRIYLPTSSYAEMAHWSLPDADAYISFEHFEAALKKQHLEERYGNFVRGGFWRNFLMKYPEINYMQKKMLRVSSRLERIEREDSSGGSKKILEEARRHLYAGQCNCPYWHGVFGGLYLMNIRSAIYRELIAAECLLDNVERLTEPRITVTDFDLDGFEEVLCEHPQFNLGIAPSRGGSIFELDDKASRYNLINTIQRRPEGYHHRLKSASGKRSGSTARSIHDAITVKESGLENALIYDPYRHGCLIDRFFTGEITAETLKTGAVKEAGDFTTGRYEYMHEQVNGDSVVILRHSGEVGKKSVQIEKRIAIQRSSADLAITYNIHPSTGLLPDCLFGIEMAFTMSAGTEPDRCYEIDGTVLQGKAGWLNSTGECTAQRIALRDEWLGRTIVLDFTEPVRIFRFPIESVSLSEDGMERIWQGSALVPVWNLSGKQRLQIELTIGIQGLEN